MSKQQQRGQVATANGYKPDGAARSARQAEIAKIVGFTPYKNQHMSSIPILSAALVRNEGRGSPKTELRDLGSG